MYKKLKKKSKDTETIQIDAMPTCLKRTHS